MIVTGMRVSTATGLVFEGHQHLVGTHSGHYIPRKNRTVLRNDCIPCIAVHDPHGNPVEMLAVLLKNVRFRPLSRNRRHRKNNLLSHLLDR